MKRSEMIDHIKADLEEMLEILELRPKTRPYIAERYANDILDMIEGFGMLPPIDPKDIFYTSDCPEGEHLNGWESEDIED